MWYIPYVIQHWKWTRQLSLYHNLCAFTPIMAKPHLFPRVDGGLSILAMYTPIPNQEHVYPPIGPQQFSAVAASPPVPHQQLPPIHSERAIRTWDTHICCCCGSCDEKGWCTFLLGLFFPCILFGKLRNRAFGDSCFAWSLLFFILLAVGLSSVRMMECSDTGSGIEDPTCELSVKNIVVIRVTREELNMIGSVGFLCLIALVIIGAITRCQIRRKFALPGTNCEDCLLWTCCGWCALCQESRTLQSNHVDNGEWYGALWPVGAAAPGYVRVPPAQHQAPIRGQEPWRPVPSAPPAPGVPLLHADYSTSTV